MLADQAANDLPALDPGGDIDGLAGLPLRGFPLQAPVRLVAVVVLGVLGQDAAEMPLAEDQHAVQALAAQRAHEPLRVGVRHGDQTGVLITRASDTVAETMATTEPHIREGTATRGCAGTGRP